MRPPRLALAVLALTLVAGGLASPLTAWCAPAGVTLTGSKSCCCPEPVTGICAMRCAKPVSSPRVAATVPDAPNHAAPGLSAGAETMFGVSSISALSIAALSERAPARPAKRYLLACNLRL